jgi:hypothetical protein
MASGAASTFGVQSCGGWPLAREVWRCLAAAGHGCPAARCPPTTGVGPNGAHFFVFNRAVGAGNEMART